MAISYVHPSVSSTITDNSTTYVTASGTTKLFAAFTSERGVDNKIQTITSASEFEFYYGEPNMKLYGQASYNIINWLNAGGSVYCLRVLPDDAGYANAIVNIQTKKSTKKIKDINGDLVTVDDVTIRPTVTYTSVNNVSKSAIEFNEMRRSTEKTVDGFQNNMLFAVIPKGRGKGYNNLGFRLTLTNTYDSTYEFRMYNFEVTETSDSGAVSTIEGPFLVSLDPDAISMSGASLFIKNVIAQYCSYYDIIFSTENYEALGEIINPYVHPNKIDFFNGTTRVVDDEPETYYDERTMKEEDIHMSLIPYDSQGDALEGRNIVDTSSSIEASIALIDNAVRNEAYQRLKDRYDRIRVSLSVIRKLISGKGSVNNFTNIVMSTMTTESGGSVTLSQGRTKLGEDTTLQDLYNAYLEALNNLASDCTTENYNIANSASNRLYNAINTLLSQLYEFYDYDKIMQNVADEYANSLSSIITRFDTVENLLTSYAVNELNCNKYIDLVNDLSAEYTQLNTDGTNTEKEAFLVEILEELSNARSILQSISSSEVLVADDKLAEIEGYLDLISDDYYDILQDPYVTDADYVEAMNEAFSTAGKLLDTSCMLFAINLTLLESKTELYRQIYATMDAVKTDDLDFYDTTVAQLPTINNYTLASSIVDAVKNELGEALQDTYTTNLQNYDSYIALLYGSDGEIEDKLYNSSEVERLIIKAFKGTIDNTLTDKDQWPIDMVLDANYSTSIKNAIVSLCTEIRGDFMGILDTGLQTSPAAAIDYRKSAIAVNNFRVAIFTQDFIVEDNEYTVSNIQVTPTFYLSSKIPMNDNNYGIHWNFVGPRRGTISNFKKISFLPNTEWREQLYRAQVNYVQQDQVSTRFNSQLTSQSTVSALSNISCVRTVLRIQREVEDLMKDFQFEFNDDQTISSANAALSNYLTQWVTNRACTTISGTVYASDYDRQQKLLRVKVELSFTNIIERIAIDIVVNQ